MDLDQMQQMFVQECRELCEQVEESLLQLEQREADSETINALFRGMHTIKGSGGLFALDELVSFTHVAESVLVKVRDGEITIDANLVALLLSCCDHVRRMIDCLIDTGKISNDDIEVDGNVILEQLKRYLDGTHIKTPITKSHQLDEVQQKVESSGGGYVNADTWHLSLRFGRDILRCGMDPASMIRYLAKLGNLVSITTLPDALPAVNDFDPEACYLGFEIDLNTGVDKATIESVFEFVRDESQIRILPPKSKIGEFVGLIKELPEDNMRLGDILINSGAITRHELDEALSEQEKTIKSTAQGKTPTPIGKILVDTERVSPQVIEAALDKQKQAKEVKAQENNSIRVDAAKLDRLINLVGELVIAGASANLLAQRANSEILSEATSVISRLVEEVRDSALQMRMVQIAATFNRFHRVVRDVSKEIGKDILLTTNGGETELDKSVVEKISDPLMHLVRNAMDHGIEQVDIRRARGKPNRGTVGLNAYHESGSIVIEVFDDGGGLDKQKILNKALAQGLVSQSQNLSEQEIFNLIFEPGFSTAEKVTNLSGRGVGMDVVKRNIVALRGTVEIASALGQGTTIRIRLPLTLAIIDGFLVRVGDAFYVVPLDMVIECVELSEDEQSKLNKQNYLNLRGEVLSFIRLRELFEEKGRKHRRESIVVVQYAGHKAGLVVDELLGEFQTVIKPLGKLFSTLRGIGGSTILGSGEVALILDVQSLIQQAEQVETLSVSGQDKYVALVR